MDTRFAFPIIVLAAGQSSRMRGRDKLLEDVGGVSLLRLQVEHARAATRGVVIVALPPAPHPRHDLLQGLDVLCIPVPDASEGMNASLRAGFAALPRDTPAAMVLLSDLPDLTTSDLQKVAAAVDLGGDMLIWRGVTQDGAPGHPIVFAASLFPAIASLTGDSGGAAVVKEAGGHVTLVPLAGDRARRDLDTPEDWARWRADKREG